MPQVAIHDSLLTDDAKRKARMLRNRGLPAYAIIGSGQFACHAATLAIVRRSMVSLAKAGWVNLRVEAMP